MSDLIHRGSRPQPRVGRQPAPAILSAVGLAKEETSREGWVPLPTSLRQDYGSARRHSAAAPWYRELQPTTGRYARSLFAVAILCAALPLAAAEGKVCSGITEPVFDVALSLAVSGIVTTRHCKEGDFVRPNDVLLELDQRLEELEVDRRRLVVENRKADWDSTKVVAGKSASVSRDELLKKEADYRVAATEYEAAVEQLRRRKLLAPGAGVITELRVRVGEACTAYQPIIRLADTRRCYFISDIDANWSAGLKTGQTVDLEIDDPLAPIKVQGTIAFVSPVVDSASGLQKVKVIFENPEGRVRPGLAGKLRLK